MPASSINSSGATIDWLQASGPIIVADPATRKANLTGYESYPAPGSEECLESNGCSGSGYFAGVDGFGLRWVLYQECGRITETGGECTPRRLMILKIGPS